MTQTQLITMIIGLVLNFIVYREIYLIIKKPGRNLFNL